MVSILIRNYGKRHVPKRRRAGHTEKLKQISEDGKGRGDQSKPILDINLSFTTSRSVESKTSHRNCCWGRNEDYDVLSQLGLVLINFPSHLANCCRLDPERGT